MGLGMFRVKVQDLSQGFKKNGQTSDTPPRETRRAEDSANPYPTYSLHCSSFLGVANYIFRFL